jgi:cell division protein FtsI/penicillin-binding protein 2
MPVVRSDDATPLDEEDRRRFHYVPRSEHVKATSSTYVQNATGSRIVHDQTSPTAPTNDSWREKKDLNETDYTRLQLNEDPEDDSIHLKTQYLFDDEKEMTPLSQMQATKTLLTEGQRIAYVGLCRLVTNELVSALRKDDIKELVFAAESAENWASKLMGRLYHHMDINTQGNMHFGQLGVGLGGF